MDGSHSSVTKTRGLILTMHSKGKEPKFRITKIGGETECLHKFWNSVLKINLGTCSCE
jgi:hypothetical protein